MNDSINRTMLVNYSIRIPTYVRNKSRRYKLEVVDQVLIANLLAVYRKGCALACPLSNNKQPIDRQYERTYNSGRKISKKAVQRAVDKLVGLCYITCIKGSRSYVDGEWKNQVTMLFPTQKLVDDFTEREVKMLEQAEKDYRETIQTIVLKDKDKAFVGYTDTEEILAMRELVHKLNEVNSRHRFTLQDVELDNSKIVRVFNVDLKHGGRFYRSDTLAIANKVKMDDGAKVELAPELRRIGMKIDGQDVVEVDFCNLHIFLALDILGHDKSRFMGDLYTSMIAPEYLGNPNNRKLFKTAVNIAINSKNSNTAEQAIRKEINVAKHLYDYTNAKDVLNIIKASLMELGHLIAPDRGEFFDGQSFGSWLQYLDSEIMALVIADFVAEDKPIVPVHDSAVTKHEDLSLLLESMASAYRKIVLAHMEEPDEDFVESLDVLMKIEYASGEKVNYKG